MAFLKPWLLTELLTKLLHNYYAAFDMQIAVCNISIHVSLIMHRFQIMPKINTKKETEKINFSSIYCGAQRFGKQPFPNSHSQAKNIVLWILTN